MIMALLRINKRTLTFSMLIMVLIAIITLPVLSCSEKSAVEIPDTNINPTQLNTEPIEPALHPDIVFSALNISPQYVKPGETVSISATVMNNQGSVGGYTAELKINGIVSQSKTIPPIGNDEYKLEFSVSEDEPGIYTVELGGLTGQFTITSPAVFKVSGMVIEPALAQFGQSVSINTTVTNTGGSGGDYAAELKINDTIIDAQTVFLAADEAKEVAFSVSQNDTGTYSVEIGGLKGQFTVEPALRVWVIKDADVTRLFSQISTVELRAHFIPGNQAEYVLGPLAGIEYITIHNGQLSMFPVDPYVYEYLASIHDYVVWDEGVAYLSFIWFDPSAEIAPDVTSIPVMVSVTTEEGQANVVYEWPPRK